MKIRCDRFQCNAQLRTFALHVENPKRYFCSPRCKTLWIEGDKRLFEATTVFPTVPKETADV
jgi:endogenous inhibitor of DNA gyrase (YacG/DUF329 family)